jgi:PIN domain nuclease of toxin-antitoxin system
MSCVLDSSALLALLLEEPGGERVLDELAEAFMTTVNFAEVVGLYARLGAEAGDIRKTLEPLPFERVPFDDELAFETGLLLPVTRPVGLSLGDRACLALAHRLNMRVLTADRSWATLGAGLGLEIDLIR